MRTQAFIMEQERNCKIWHFLLQLIMEEKLVGIDAFLSEGKGFPFLMKLKFSDFIVNEITRDKRCLFITDQSLWKEFDKVKLSHKEYMDEKNEKHENKEHKDRNEVDIAQVSQQPSAFANFNISQEFLQEGESLLGKETIDKILELVETIKIKNFIPKFEIKIPLPEDKAQRVKIHQLIRNHLPFLETSSKTSDNLKKNQKNQKIEQKLSQQPTQPSELDVNYISIKANTINFKKFKSSSQVTGQKEPQQQQVQQEKKKKFLTFMLMKRNLDTINAGIIIGKFLNISNKHFGYAGIKKIRIKEESQLKIAHSKELQQINQQTSSKKEIGIRISFSLIISIRTKDLSKFQTNQYQRLGDLYGNRFSVPSITDRWEIVKNLQSLKEHGFINFYGLQRFGMNRKIKTHQIGREIIRSQWKTAFEYILKSSCMNDTSLLICIEEFLVDHDVNKILKVLPVKLRLERILIQGLVNNNYLNAILKLPRNVREIYAHAYQSFLWNKLASRRISRFGKEPCVGDLVLAKGEVKDEDVCEEDEQEVIEEDQQLLDPKESSEVIILTEDNIHNYNSQDIVLPIYGSKTNIPKESILNSLLEEVFLEEGISENHFDQASKMFYLEGGYRSMIQIPENFQYQILAFNDKEQELVTPFYQADKAALPEEGKYMAVVIQMDLKKSSYATMLIRELTKQTTSLDYQQELNDMYRQL